jgi:hypothetical protein
MSYRFPHVRGGIAGAASDRKKLGRRREGQKRGVKGGRDRQKRRRIIIGRKWHQQHMEYSWTSTPLITGLTNLGNVQV